MGLANAFDDDNPDLTTFKGWKTAHVGDLALEAISRENNAHYAAFRNKLTRARYVSLGFAMAGALYALLLFRSLWGRYAGALACVLIGLHPTLLAQARYVTTDGPAATLTLVTLGELLRFLRSPTRTRLFTLSTAAGIATITKHSLMLLPLVCIGAIACFLLFGLGSFKGLPARVRLWRWGAACIAISFACLFTINAGYRFERTGQTVATICAAPEPQYQVSKSYHHRVIEESPIGKLPQWLPVPLPYTHIFGLACVRALNAGGYPSFFMGESYRDGRALYFPVLTVLKSPPSVLLSFLLVLVASRWKRRAPEPEHLVLGAVFCLLLGLSMLSRLNMGIRHGLPAMMTLTMLAASLLGSRMPNPQQAELGERRPQWRAPALGSVSAVALVATTLISSLSSRESPLNYFNLLVKNIEQAHEISVIGEDWGQDRAKFAILAREAGLTPLFYHEQTATRRAEARYLGIRYKPLTCKSQPPPGSFAAVHQTPLRQSAGRCFRFTQGRTPVATIHDDILVYWIPPKGSAESPKQQSPATVEPEQPDSADSE
jgi:hypothetical protein